MTDIDEAPSKLNGLTHCCGQFFMHPTLVRLSSIYATSSLIHHTFISETLTGLSTVRAYREQVFPPQVVNFYMRLTTFTPGSFRQD